MKETRCSPLKARRSVCDHSGIAIVPLFFKKGGGKGEGGGGRGRGGREGGGKVLCDIRCEGEGGEEGRYCFVRKVFFFVSFFFFFLFFFLFFFFFFSFFFFFFSSSFFFFDLFDLFE